MFLNANRVLALVSLFATLQVGFVAAQVGDDPADGSSAAPASPTGTGGDTSCIQSCLETAAAGVGCDPTDVTCACTNTDVQTAVAACIQTNCPDQLATAQQEQAQLCSGVESTPAASGASSAPASTLSSVPLTSTHPAAGGASTTGAGAASTKPPTSASSGASTTPSSGAVGKVALGGGVAAVLGAVGAVVGLVL